LENELLLGLYLFCFDFTVLMAEFVTEETEPLNMFDDIGLVLYTSETVQFHFELSHWSVPEWVLMHLKWGPFCCRSLDVVYHVLSYVVLFISSEFGNTLAEEECQDGVGKYSLHF
jgi:hypothetical protein